MSRHVITLSAAMSAALLLSPACRPRMGSRLAADMFVVRGVDTGGADAEAAIRGVLDTLDAAATPAGLELRYPFAGSLFPPEIVAPEVLWHDDSAASMAWLVTVSFGDSPHSIHVLCDGARRPPEIDALCASPGNRFQEAARIAVCRGWVPGEAVWALMKMHSVSKPLTLTIRGLTPSDGDATRFTAVSRGSVSFRTADDPVGAPLFYRDVPLRPSRTQDGVIQPLAVEAIPLIKWRLRDISKPVSRVVMENIPTCANCHSFTPDGRRLAMDMDGPAGDKGAHTVVAVQPKMTVEREQVFSWNDFTTNSAGQGLSFGLFPQISPDGRYVAATIYDEVYVMNYMDFRFLQTFYPTRGIIGVYDTKTGAMRPLPGADDSRFVQSNPVWSPDGKRLVFIRAPAQANYGDGPRAKYANDPNETQIRYDLYSIPFNAGRGGTATPVQGACGNGMSHSFPKFSPDGKWIVFVRCRNGLLMRPDSRLCILPAAGGRPRVMNCNLDLMNSWHSWSPNGKWLAFSSKAFRPFTQIFLTHIDDNGTDSRPVLLPGSTADNRAVNLPEFVNMPADGLMKIDTPALDYRRLLTRAVELSNDGRHRQAEKYLLESMALKPGFPRTLISYGVVLDATGRSAEAVQQYQAALRLEPRSPDAHSKWALALIRQRRYEEALGHLRSAVSLDPEFDEAYQHWGDLLALTGEADAAAGLYRKTLELNPSNAFAHHNLASLLRRRGEVGEAVKHYRLALQYNEGYAEAYCNLANLLWNSGSGGTGEVIDLYRKAVAARPDYAAAIANLGLVLSATGDVREALNLLRRAVALNPRHWAAHSRLAWLLAAYPEDRVRDGEQALKHAEAACRLTGGREPRCLAALAAAQAEAGRFEAAVKTAEQAWTLAREDKALRAEIEDYVLGPLRRARPVRRKKPCGLAVPP